MEPFAPKGIRFNDYVFSEPTPLTAWTPPHFAGLLVVQLQDEEWAPRRFQPVYFCEFGNNAHQPLAYGEYSRLMNFAGSRPLYVSVLPMPFTTTAQRCSLRDELIWAYNPAWQAASGKRNAEPHPVEMPRRRIGFLPDLAG
jgi:hypothetical protein